MSGSNIFAGTDRGVFLSTDNGTSWTAVNSGLKDRDTTNVLSLAVSGSNIFAGTDSGVFHSTNNGTSWTAISSGLPANSTITALAISYSNIFAGTKSGVWRRPLSEVTEVARNAPVTEPIHRTDFKIHHPGAPGSPVTIEFSLPRSSIVILAVYNLSGHKIASLVNKNLESGLHHVMWDTRHIAAGIYAIRMLNGSTSIMNSIPILR
jgi:hypothetical protein